jgi:hypothetical protein
LNELPCGVSPHRGQDVVCVRSNVRALFVKNYAVTLSGGPAGWNPAGLLSNSQSHNTIPAQLLLAALWIWPQDLLGPSYLSSQPSVSCWPDTLTFYSHIIKINLFDAKEIFSYLSPFELGTIARVCSSWNEVTLEPTIPLLCNQNNYESERKIGSHVPLVLFRYCR